MASKGPKGYSSDPKTRAAELVRDGKLGQAQPNAGRRKKSVNEGHQKRASTVVAEYVRENGDEFAAVLERILRDPTASDAIKMRATKLALSIETGEEVRKREDERVGQDPELPDPDDRDAVVSHLAETLSDPIVRNRLAAVLAGSPAQMDD